MVTVMGVPIKGMTNLPETWTDTTLLSWFDFVALDAISLSWRAVRGGKRGSNTRTLSAASQHTLRYIYIQNKIQSGRKASHCAAQ